MVVDCSNLLFPQALSSVPSCYRRDAMQGPCHTKPYQILAWVASCKFAFMQFQSSGVHRLDLGLEVVLTRGHPATEAAERPRREPTSAEAIKNGIEDAAVVGGHQRMPWIERCG